MRQAGVRHVMFNRCGQLNRRGKSHRRRRFNGEGELSKGGGSANVDNSNSPITAQNQGINIPTQPFTCCFRLRQNYRQPRQRLTRSSNFRAHLKPWTTGTCECLQHSSSSLLWHLDAKMDFDNWSRRHQGELCAQGGSDSPCWGCRPQASDARLQTFRLQTPGSGLRAFGSR